MQKNTGRTHFKKGDNLTNKNINYKKSGYTMVALHEFIKRRLAKPLGCDSCGEIKKLDLANKSHNYKRAVSDWLWLCRKCHTSYDNNNIGNYVIKNPLFYNRWSQAWEERQVK